MLSNISINSEVSWEFELFTCDVVCTPSDAILVSIHNEVKKRPVKRFMETYTCAWIIWRLEQDWSLEGTHICKRV